MKKALLLVLLLSAVLIAGCTSKDLSKRELEKIQLAKEFFYEYPDAKIHASYFAESAFDTVRGLAPSKCRKIQRKAYWKAMITSENETLYLYLDGKTLELECAYREGDKCQKNEDCDDQDPKTSDYCTGKPKKCLHNQKTCADWPGFICTETQECPGNFIEVLDSDKCCPIECTEIDPCLLADCNADQACIDGECVYKSCGELEGEICDENMYCLKEFVKSSDTGRCCPGPCSETDPCLDVNCLAHLKCVLGRCVLKTCAERGGTACQEDQLCDSDFASASDSNKCCLGPCSGGSATPAPTATPTTTPTATPAGTPAPPGTPPQGDLSVSGDLASGWISASSIVQPNCGGQELYFTLGNSFGENVELVKYDVSVDGDNYAETYAYLLSVGNGIKILPGENTAYFSYNLSPPGHTVRVEVDPYNEIAESDETNNVIETTFAVGDKMDLFYAESYKAPYGQLSVDINRDLKLDYCPPFDNEVYVDGVRHEEWSHQFSGFHYKEGFQGYFRVGDFEPGTYEIRLVIDKENQVLESDETNNDVTFTVEILE